jgi:hypothetical protein
MQAGARLDHAGLTPPAQTAAYVQTLCTTAYNAALANGRDGALDMVTLGALTALELAGDGTRCGPPLAQVLVVVMVGAAPSLDVSTVRW